MEPRPTEIRPRKAVLAYPSGAAPRRVAAGVAAAVAGVNAGVNAGVGAAQAGDPMTRAADLNARVLRKFRLVFNSVKAHLQQIERHAGMGGAQLWALSVIDQRPGVGVKALAQAMDLRQPTASNLVKSLVAMGLVEVRKEATDRRSVQLYVSAEGAALIGRTPGPFEGVLPQALAALDDRTLGRLDHDLTVVIGRLDRESAADPASATGATRSSRGPA